MSKLEVAIFGGGIAGLTAAQELVERGFRVEVFEAKKPSVPDRLQNCSCALGGMARTQWATVPQRNPFDDAPSTMEEAQPLDLLLDGPGDQPWLPRHHVLFRPDDAGIDTAGSARIDELFAVLAGRQGLKIEIHGHTTDRSQRTLETDPASARYDMRRAIAVRDALVAKGIAADSLIPLGMGLGCPDDWRAPDACRRSVTFHLREDWLPGEHGFRYFPAYYRNVFDTMRRIPILRDGDRYAESPRTVIDNLVPTSLLAYKTLHSPEPFPYQTKPRFSLRNLIEQLKGMLRVTGGGLSDVQLFQRKLFQYATSCCDRREEYAKLSWFDYLEAHRASPAFQQELDGGGEVLVSMQAKRCDARSYGSASVQVMAAMLDPSGRTDATLNAPTSVAWFDPWRRYLESQGVVFRHGELDGFVASSEVGGAVWPVVKLKNVDGSDGGTIVVDRDYYVLATGAHDLQRLVSGSPLQGADFHKVRLFPLGDPGLPETGGALEHMSGIQYYFENDLCYVSGHLMFPTSPYRLSAIFQPQFWQQKRGWWSGYRGILSVDISNWHNGNDTYPAIAWNLDKPALAETIAKQLNDAKLLFRTAGHSFSKLSGTTGLLAAAPRPFTSTASCSDDRRDKLGEFHIPPPLYFHVDEDMEYGDRSVAGVTKTMVVRNHSPYLICRPGEYASRPGRPGKYEVWNGYVIAGTLMQTHMRLTTMEAANESGRHAVNAILEDAEKLDADLDWERCQIFNLEDYEPEDLRFFVELDQQLHDLELPHFLEIFDVQDLSELLPDDEAGADAAEPEIVLGEER